MCPTILPSPSHSHTVTRVNLPRRFDMMCARLCAYFTPSLSLTKSTPLLRLPHNTRINLTAIRSSSSSSVKMSQTIEHIVLFKIKENTDPTKVTTMINGLNGLTSLDSVLHLSAGPIHRNRSSSFNFTHMLHSRYKNKEDLGNYAAHPSHMGVVKESVLPICDDIMSMDWIADLDEPIVHPSGGDVIRVNFLKLKEGLGDGEKSEILKVISGVKNYFGGIKQLSFGENFSPARAKGFSIGSIGVFSGLSDLEELDTKEEIVKEQKEKVRDLLEGVIVVDYVLSSPQSASL